MNQPAPTPAIPSEEDLRAPQGRDRRSPSTAALIGGLAAVAAIVITVVLVVRSDGAEGETRDISEQGRSGTSLHEDAARLVRRVDGLVGEIDMPTPAPGSYDYPTGDMVPPGADPHPAVNAGASDAPEVFTAWLIAFNHPERCTEGMCDADDIGPDSAAQGGSYQLDGRIGDGDRLTFSGSVRVGQEPAGGARLVEPMTAEVHFAVAPHGRVLPGADGWRQLNSAVGRPDFWWGASFLP